MKFDELDRRMRQIEEAYDFCVPEDQHLVVRLDGRSFTRLTKELHSFEAPFDPRFRDTMFETARHMMACGFKTTLAYTQSDEISLLLAPDEAAFGRKLRKLNSVLAGEASAKFSLLLGSHAVFDCRVSQLPTLSVVIDYFRWRSEDAYRNSLSAHCYWQLRKKGDAPRQAARAIEGMASQEKIDLLLHNGIDFEKLPGWQKQGSMFVWEEVEKEGYNPVTGEATRALRRRIRSDSDLPRGPEFTTYLERLLESHHTPASG